jgi:hypothetical protein
MKPNPEFVDAQEMHRLHPTTFEAPYAEELAAIEPGDFVKICTGGERFWVKVDEHTPPHLVGRVDNELIGTDEHGLACNDVVRFEERHVFQTLD